MSVIKTDVLVPIYAFMSLRDVIFNAINIYSETN